MVEPDDQRTADNTLTPKSTVFIIATTGLAAFAFAFTRNLRRASKEAAKLAELHKATTAETRDVQAEGAQLAGKALLTATGLVAGIGMSIPIGLHYIGGFNSVQEFSSASKRVLQSILPERDPSQTKEEDLTQLYEYVNQLEAKAKAKPN
eukprot:m.153359 g.153359  ORF g.153359 m.153359 type:complete len:150 (-) comp16368_c0_seq3:4303-4752(-)